MSERPQSSEAHDTAFLLAAAEQQRLQRGGNSSLVLCLLDEVYSRLSAEYIHVWEITDGAESRVLWTRGQIQSNPDRSRQAVFGQVRRLAAASDPSGIQFSSSYVARCEVGEGVSLVLEIAVPDEVFDQQQILELAEVLADLHRRHLTSVLLQQSRRVEELRQILAMLHADLDPVRVATSLASDSAEFLQCQRISVARRLSQYRWELVSATAVTQPDPRSDASRRLCEAIDAECRAGGPAGAGFAEKTPVEYLVRPLSVSGVWDDADWAAVFEWSTESTEQTRSNPFLAVICHHAALAFRNCSAYNNAGMFATLARLPRSMRTRRTFIAGTLFAASAAALIFLKLDLKIEVTGKLIPSQRIFVFAPEDGVITDVFVEDGASVSTSGLMCRLRNEDLEIQLEAIDGEVASTQARLAALDSLRGDRSLTQSGLFSVEQAELKERLIALEAQAVILNRRIERLDVSATMDGRIYGDRIQELLKGRPVQRGQYLFELANPDGGWQIDMRVPEVDVRHVIREQAKSESALPVSFAVETAPDKELSTTLAGLSQSTEIDEFGRLSVLATAVPEKADILNPRPGAGVVGRIHCGSQPAGYVLFRRIIESFQRRWWK